MANTLDIVAGQRVQLTLTLTNTGGTTANAMIDAFVGNNIPFKDSTGNSLPVVQVPAGQSTTITLTTDPIDSTGDYTMWLYVTDSVTGATYFPATNEGTLDVTTSTTSSGTSGNPTLAAFQPQIELLQATRTSLMEAVQSYPSSAGIVKFEYFHTDASGNFITDLGGTSDGIIDITGLACGSAYHTRVIAYDAYGNSSQLSPVFSTQTAAC